MKSREHFRHILRERRKWPRGSSDWEYRTCAARAVLVTIRKPVTYWSPK